MLLAKPTCREVIGTITLAPYGLPALDRLWDINAIVWRRAVALSKGGYPARLAQPRPSRSPYLLAPQGAEAAYLESSGVD